jgi:hypothetical protein
VTRYAAQVVVDRPDITRKACLLKRLAVTDLKADVTRLPKKTKLTTAFSGALPSSSVHAQHVPTYQYTHAPVSCVVHNVPELAFHKTPYKLSYRSNIGLHVSFLHLRHSQHVLATQVPTTMDQVQLKVTPSVPEVLPCSDCGQFSQISVVNLYRY